MRKNPGSSYHKKTDTNKGYKKDASRKSGSADNKPFRKDKEEKDDRPKRKFDGEEKRSFSDRPKRTFGNNSFERKNDLPKRSFKKDENTESIEGRKKPFERKPFDKNKNKTGTNERTFSNGKDDKKFDRKDKFAVRKTGFDHQKPFDKNKKTGDEREKAFRKDERGERKFDRKEKFSDRKRFEDNENPVKRAHKPSFKKELPEEINTRKSYPSSATKEIESAMTLNKYIAHSGECSRRDAAEMVKQGKVRVNGELILEPGYRVEPGDQVTLSGKKLTPQKNLVYVLLNKPKGYITTTEDPEERKTVMDLVASAGVDRLFPVGRLDRNTTGVLLLTNDGALAHKLSHPSYNMKKVYHVTLDKNLTRADYEKISKGVELEDGVAQVDAIAYLENRHEVGLEIHSGKNRIVRRIFESLGYVVEKLDRVMYAGLTKKNVTRGKWRFLDEKEIIFLKHFKG